MREIDAMGNICFRCGKLISEHARGVQCVSALSHPALDGGGESRYYYGAHEIQGLEPDQLRWYWPVGGVGALASVAWGLMKERPIEGMIPYARALRTRTGLSLSSSAKLGWPVRLAHACSDVGREVEGEGLVDRGIPADGQTWLCPVCDERWVFLGCERVAQAIIARAHKAGEMQGGWMRTHSYGAPS